MHNRARATGSALPEDRIARREAMDLVPAVYGATDLSLSCEVYRLTDPMGRAAVSIPGNIAEGPADELSRLLSGLIHSLQGDPQTCRSVAESRLHTHQACTLYRNALL